MVPRDSIRGPLDAWDAKPACVAARAVIRWPFEGMLGDVIGLFVHFICSAQHPRLAFYKT